MSLSCKVIQRLQGKTLVTAESITGGGIGSALTAVPGSSTVYKGGVISYCDEIKHRLLGVSWEILTQQGAVSSQTALRMAEGVRKLLNADVAVSVTGVAGPGGDNFGHSLGTVFIGYQDERFHIVRECHFTGDRDAVRQATVQAALELILEYAEKA